MDDELIIPKIGVFFTPPTWAKWVITKFEICDRWLQGATIFDPTAGEGVFLEVLIELAISQGIKITAEMLDRLWANEWQQEFIDRFLTRIHDQYDLDFPIDNFLNQDILSLSQDLQVDIIVGNPPWQNFNNLPPEYKQKIKPLFHKYDLVSNSQALLLGSSRIDLATLIISKVLQKNLKQSGQAYLFMPLSAFLNDGAAKGFRSYQINDIDFCVQEIYDFKKLSIFEHVNTRYGLVKFQRDRKQEFPIRYFLYQHHSWQEYQAKPLFQSNEPLTILQNAVEFLNLEKHEKITISKDSKPRQGVNCCGANHVFIFSQLEEVNDVLVRVSNQVVQDIILPKQFIFPLIAKQNFQQAQPLPEKYILLPCDRINGKPILLAELLNHPELLEYLLQHQNTLQNRKGTLIQASIKKGFWYALLGVGKYTFAPYKVIWQAYGQKQFTAKLFDGIWQGNQAIHAFMPVSSKNDGEKLVEQLNDPMVEKYLHSQQTAGTCNWAQPGRITRLLELI
jgi:hypothetical protein